MNTSKLWQAILAWLITSTISAQFIQHVVLHDKCLPAAIFTGVILGLWVALPLLLPWQIERYNRLSPVPRRYVVERDTAFEKVCAAVKEIGWEIGSSKEHKLHATLEEVSQTPNSVGTGKAHFSMDVDLEQSENSVVVHLQTRISGRTLDHWEHSSLVDSVYSNIDHALGIGTDITNLALYTVKAPPWWLLILTGVAIACLAKFVIA